MSQTELGNLPYFVIGGYLLMLLMVGYIGYRRSINNEEDYYLAGRQQGWIVSSLTIMATFFSSAALLGVPGSVYKEGAAFVLFALNVPLCGSLVYVFGHRIARIGRSRGYVTPGDMIADYYNSPVVLRLLAAFVGFFYAVPYVVMQIRAGGFISQQMFQVPYAFEIGASLLSVIMMVYVILGGMRSIALADVVQGTLLISGMFLAGIAAVAALGGISGFFEAISKLPARSLSVPGTTGSWMPEKLFTVCVFASMGSMIQPAQWMRYYSARSRKTLRRSALVFAIVLTSCFIFGVMLVGLGGQALYPIQQNGEYRFEVPSLGQPNTTEMALMNPDQTEINWNKLLPHPKVGTKTGDFDQIMIVVLREHMPGLMGRFALPLFALILIAIIAAAMSTAAGNLHALSAVLTRDVYDRFINPTSNQRQRKWVGRAVIVMATLTALVLVIVSRHSDRFNPIAMIIPLLILAIAFSTQLLPVTIDILFIRRGCRAGAIAGTLAGLAIVFLFSPFLSILTECLGIAESLSNMKKMIDVGAWALIGNVMVFVLVSLVAKPPDAKRIADFADSIREKIPNKDCP